MRKLLAVALAIGLLSMASLAKADVGFSINVGGPPIVIQQPPDFLYPPELGFGVAVGVPYDLIYLNGVYYVFRGGGWYRASYWGDSWIRVPGRGLPPELRRYRIGRIHEFRDREYRMYVRDRDHYRGQHFRPEGRREERHEMRERGREERHEDMRERHEERREEHREDRR
jgi:hypothetical protein